MKTKNIINCMALLVVAVVVIAADSLNFVTGIVSAAVLCVLAVLVNTRKRGRTMRETKIKRLRGLFWAVVILIISVAFI